MKVIGVDPGTKSFDIFGLENDAICIDTSILTKTVFESPQNVLEIIKSQEPFDYLAAPSGFGLPFRKVQELTEKDIFEMVLRKPKSTATIGLQSVIEALRKTSWNAFTIPGVKHLPTVPQYRKINKIDLGTADKVCSVVVGIRDMIESLNIEANQASFIMIEMGSGFSAVIAVQNGQIIDGIGGSNLMGFKAAGSIDGELAYLLGTISKKIIYSGGVTSIAGFPELSPNEVLLLAKRDEKVQNALSNFVESIIKAAYSLLPSFTDPNQIQQILLSGNIAKVSTIQKQLIERLAPIKPTRVMKSYAHIAKEAAQGAAFIADGMMGGRFRAIIDRLQLKNARGKVLDDIYLPIDLPKNLRD